MTRMGIIPAAVLSAVLSVASFAQSVSPMQSAPDAAARPIAKLQEEALKAEPPKGQGKFAYPQLLELTKVDPSIHLEIRYATANNFLGQAVYGQARAFLQLPAAYALKYVSEKLHAKGYGLLVYDAYRPWYVTKIFWDATPMDKREFVADPAQGSLHNRGCAVDLTLYELRTGAAVVMPSGYDEMTPRAYANYAGGTAEEREHRAILREAMESVGFVQRPNEWWHFDYRQWQRYEILNLPFDRLPVVDPSAIFHATLMKGKEPTYPKEAKEKGIQGTVVLSILVDENGTPRDLRVERGLGYGLEEAAIEAVKQWKFKPAKYNGKEVATAMNVAVNFHLN